jgi:hypothetical protein
MPTFLIFFAEKSKGLFFALARGPNRHETALDLFTFCRLHDSLSIWSQRSANIGAATYLIISEQ